MSNYISLYETHRAYESAAKVTSCPNVSYCECQEEVHYNRYTPSNTIRYYAPSKLSETTNTSLSGLHTNAFGGVSIVSHTFSGGVGKIVFNNELSTIGNYAFYGCSAMTSVDIPDTISSLGQEAFGNSGIEEILLPNELTSFGFASFGSCTKLKSISIPSGITAITSSCFQNCSGLTEVELSTSVTTIGNAAFSDCTSLTSITIPYTVTTIDSNAFAKCSGLTSINIPYMNALARKTNLSTIGAGAFSGCTSLTSVTIDKNAVVTLSNANAFASTNNCPILVTNGYVTMYKNAANWSSLSSRIYSLGSSNIHICISGNTFIPYGNMYIYATSAQLTASTQGSFAPILLRTYKADEMIKSNGMRVIGMRSGYSISDYIYLGELSALASGISGSVYLHVVFSPSHYSSGQTIIGNAACGEYTVNSDFSSRGIQSQTCSWITIEGTHTAVGMLNLSFDSAATSSQYLYI